LYEGLLISFRDVAPDTRIIYRSYSFIRCISVSYYTVLQWREYIANSLIYLIN